MPIRLRVARFEGHVVGLMGCPIPLYAHIGKRQINEASHLACHEKGNIEHASVEFVPR